MVVYVNNIINPGYFVEWKWINTTIPQAEEQSTSKYWRSEIRLKHQVVRRAWHALDSNPNQMKYRTS